MLIEETLRGLVFADTGQVTPSHCICGHSDFLHLVLAENQAFGWYKRPLESGVCRFHDCPCGKLRHPAPNSDGMHYCGGELIYDNDDEPATCNLCG